MEEISWQDFEKVELRIGKIISADEYPEAKVPAYIIKADFGTPFGIKKSSARITHHYTPEDLIGKQIIGVLNFPPKQIGKIRSEFLLTGFYDNENAVILAIPDKTAPLGARLA